MDVAASARSFEREARNSASALALPGELSKRPVPEEPPARAAKTSAVETAMPGLARA